MCVKEPVTDGILITSDGTDPGSAETPEHCFRSDRGVYMAFFGGRLKEDDRMIGFWRHFYQNSAEVYTHQLPTIHVRYETRTMTSNQLRWESVHGCYYRSWSKKKTLVLNQNCPIEVMGMAWLFACSDSPPNRKPLFTLRVACFFVGCQTGWSLPPGLFQRWNSSSIGNHFYQVFWCSLLDDWKGWVGKSRSIHECKKDMRNKISRVLLLYFFFNSWFLEDPDKAPLILAELVGGSQWFEDAEVPFVGVVGGTAS